MSDPAKTALVICYSRLESDPRVTRQIDWLTAAGWTVDTLGFGDRPRPAVRQHFALQPFRGLRKLAAVRLAFHALLPNSPRFRALEGSRIPQELYKPELRGSYGLVLVNDIDLLPWVEWNAARLLSNAPAGRCHLDLHEYHSWVPANGSSPVTRWLFAGYHQWHLAFVGSKIFTSRSTVAAHLAELYAQDFAVPLPSVVRNSPAFVEQAPSPVDPDQIDLVYHGYAELARGLHLLIDAMRLMEDRFVLNLLLTGSLEQRAALASMTARLGSRVRFIDAVPMNEVASTINKFDLEVIFLPPSNLSFEYALPNKFFEAVQGRLGVVIGDSLSMTEITRQYGNGLVVEGWAAKDLAGAINALTTEDIRRLKQGSVMCATEFNSESESSTFLRSIEPD